MRLIGCGLVLVMSLGFAIAQGVGGVDFTRVINESDLAKKNATDLQAMATAYDNLLQTMDANPLMPDDERQEFANKALMPNPSQADKDRVNALIESAKRRAMDLNDLRNKPANQLTEAEKQRLNDLSQMETKGRDAVRNANEQLKQAFDKQVAEKQKQVLDAIRKAVSDVAKAEKVSIIYNLGLRAEAPVLYIEKDLTDAVIKKLNGK